MLFITDYEVSLYKDSLLNSSEEINSKETVSMKTLTYDDSLNIYVAEYFGPIRKVNFYFERIDGVFTVIPSEKIETMYNHHCTRDSIGKSEYFAGSFENILNYNLYYLYLKQHYGLVNAYYTNIIDIQGISNTIFPKESSVVFNGVSKLADPHFVMKLECIYPGEGYIRLLQPSYNIFLKDEENDESSIHVLTQGTDRIQLIDLIDRNIELELIGINRNQDYPNVIKVKLGLNSGTLTIDSKVLRFSKVKDTVMTVKNPFESIAVEFKLCYDTFTKIKGDRSPQYDKYIYYHLTIAKAPYYVFEFNRGITHDLTYTLNKGIDGFIVKPMKNVLVNTESGNSFSVPNPYYTYYELSSNEFWYVSLKIPDDTFYELFVDTKSSEIPSAPMITPLGMQLLKVNRNSLEINKDRSKPILVLFFARCNKKDSQLNI